MLLLDSHVKFIEFSFKQACVSLIFFHNIIILHLGIYYLSFLFVRKNFTKSFIMHAFFLIDFHPIFFLIFYIVKTLLAYNFIIVNCKSYWKG
jgi:hypothetical protein